MTVSKSMTINGLVHAPKACIFAMVNTNKTKRIQFFYSNNFTNTLLTHLHKLQNGLHENKALQTDLKNIEVIIIETFNEPQDIILYKYIIYNLEKEYRNKKYTIYKPYKKPNGKLKIFIESPSLNHPYKAIVKLIIGIQQTYVLCEFDSIPEAKRICTKGYGDNTNNIETLLRTRIK